MAIPYATARAAPTGKGLVRSEKDSDADAQAPAGNGMNTLLRVAQTLPRILVPDPPMTDEEFDVLCRENDVMQLERTKEGAIRIQAPTGGWTSRGSTTVGQLGPEYEHGYDFDSSGGFRLPDGSTLSPDVSYLSKERLKGSTEDELSSFPPVCPDFVIELLSR